MSDRFREDAVFSSARGACMVWSDAIYVMVLDRALFATFSVKEIVDARAQTTGHFALALESREEMEAAVATGGRSLHEAENEGFMYSCAFEDPDGHGYEPFWMAPAAAQHGTEAAPA